MTLSPAGLLTGTPVNPGIRTVTIAVHDTWLPPTAATQTFTFDIRPDVFLQTLGIGSDSALVSYRRANFLDSCSLTLSRQSDFSVVDQAVTDVPGPASRLKGWSSLVPSTDYFQRVTCGDVSRTSQFTTRTASAAPSVTVPFTSRPPVNRGIQSMVVDYGATPALGNSAQTACAVNCEGTVQNQPLSLLWIRRRYLDGNGNVVATSSTHPIFTAAN